MLFRPFFTFLPSILFIYLLLGCLIRENTCDGGDDIYCVMLYYRGIDLYRLKNLINRRYEQFFHVYFVNVTLKLCELNKRGMQIITSNFQKGTLKIAPGTFSYQKGAGYRLCFPAPTPKGERAGIVNKRFGSVFGYAFKWLVIQFMTNNINAIVFQTYRFSKL